MFDIQNEKQIILSMGDESPNSNKFNVSKNGSLSKLNFPTKQYKSNRNIRLDVADRSPGDNVVVIKSKMDGSSKNLLSI